MLPRTHIFLGFIFSLILYLAFPSIGLFEFGIIFLASFLIDVDAYISYILNEKDFSLKRAIKTFTERRKKFFSLPKEKRKEIPNKKRNIRIFHGFEILVLSFLLGIFLSEFFIYVLIGFTFHLFLDLIEQIYSGLNLTKTSLAYSLYLKYIHKQ